MFSVLNKFWNFFYTEELDDEDEKQDSSNKTEEQDINNTHDAEEKKKNFNGKVTHVFSNHGLIDGEIYFSFDCVVGGLRPQVGIEVNCVAKQEHRGGGWSAEQINIIKNWELTQHDSKIVKLNGNEPVVAEPETNVPTIGVVTKCVEGRGLINDNISFMCDNCVDGFSPQAGDWVKFDLVGLDVGDSGQTYAGSVSPLRTQESEGCVSAFMRDHGYIEGEIYFESQACSNGYRPQRGDKVKVVAIESIQGKCGWRAVSVICTSDVRSVCVHFSAHCELLYGETFRT